MPPSIASNPAPLPQPDYPYDRKHHGAFSERCRFAITGARVAMVQFILCLATGWAGLNAGAFGAEPAPNASAPVVTPSPPVYLVATNELVAIRTNLNHLGVLAGKIAEAQAKEGSSLVKIRDTFVSNFLWEIFGFKKTEKTIVGQLLAILGILGLVMKLLLSFRRQNTTEPLWFRILSIGYLVLAVLAFSALSFSGGLANELQNPQNAARAIVEVTKNLETAIQTRLRAIDDRLSRPISVDVTAFDTNARRFLQELENRSRPTVQAGASTNRETEGELGLALRSLKSTIDEAAIQATAAARNAQVAAEKATLSAEKAGDAAGHSTGWGWHLILFLLTGVILVVILTKDH